uniref:TEP-2 n=1 Tax=Reishia clavigera TaxID=272940 RepID=A0A0C6E5W2_REICL|nr:TEP-2 precursor [Reishia clavigera]
MKTDIQQALCLAMTLFVIVSTVIKPSEGKCYGKWAMHACWGGNGKRSDPSADLAPNPSVLRQLLLRNPPALDSREDASSYSDGLPEYNVPPPPAPSVSRLAALLRTLRTLQRENDALP